MVTKSNPMDPALLIELQPTLLQICRTIARVHHFKVSPEDLLQETNYNLIRMGGNYHRGMGTGYLATVAFNIAVGILRKESRRRKFEREYGKINKGKTQEPVGPEYAELIQTIRTALEKMPLELRTALFLHYREVSRRDIARMLGYKGAHPKKWGFEKLKKAKITLATKMGPQWKKLIIPTKKQTRRRRKKP